MPCYNSLGWTSASNLYIIMTYYFEKLQIYNTAKTQWYHINIVMMKDNIHFYFNITSPKLYLRQTDMSFVYLVNHARPTLCFYQKHLLSLKRKKNVAHIILRHNRKKTIVLQGKQSTTRQKLMPKTIPETHHILLQYKNQNSVYYAPNQSLPQSLYPVPKRPLQLSSI